MERGVAATNHLPVQERGLARNAAKSVERDLEVSRVADRLWSVARSKSHLAADQVAHDLAGAAVDPLNSGVAP
jgi:hypothetical protein